MHALARGVTCAGLAAVAWTLAPEAPTLRAGLTLFVFIGSLWVSQALHLTVTALLVPLLAAAAGLLPMRDALAPFAHPVIFLFLGGFALATALSRHGIDQWLAVAVLRLARGRQAVAVCLLFLLTAFLSMWISNTATVAMMLPLALGMLRDNQPPPADATEAPQPVAPPSRERIFVLLGLAYSASIGGIATLVGSPPNAIAAAQAGIGFAQWMGIALPLVAVLWPAMVVTLYLLLRPSRSARITIPEMPLQWTRDRQVTVLIFGITVVGWMAGAPLGRALGLQGDIDTLVSLLAIVLLCATGALHWRDIEFHTPWNVLLLFGGGLALSEVMAATGASRYLADQVMLLLHGASALVLLLSVVLFVVLLTELVSNTASAPLLVPIFLGVAHTLQLPPVPMAAAIAMAASCAFMLPLATPPNAIVFATGQVPQGTMMRCGIALNLVCAAIITTMMHGHSWR